MASSQSDGKALLRILLSYKWVCLGVAFTGVTGYMKLLFYSVIFYVVASLTILRGANVSHNVILKPLKPGVFNITSAMVTYEAKEGADQQVSWMPLYPLKKSTL